MSAEIITQRGTYQCAVCGSMLTFDHLNLTQERFAIGYCNNGHDCGDPMCAVHLASCAMWRVKLKVPFERMTVDVL